MKPEVRKTVIQVALPALGLVVLVAVALGRGLSRVDLGLVWPSAGQAALWLSLFAALAVTQEVLWRMLRLPEPEPWKGKYTTGMVVARAIAIILLAPVAEELLFRGILYHDLLGTPLGRWGAIGIPALAFTALHFQYGLRGAPFILASGIFYGLTRDVTGSTLLTMVCHALGNTYAVWERVRKPAAAAPATPTT